jgi:HK97 family phage prohead protease
MKTKFLQTRDATGDETSASCTITTSDVDRDGDVVQQAGLDTTNFMKNPTVLWCHSYSSLPVGVCTSLAKTANGLRATWQWLKGDEFAARVANAWRQGALNACSIGFRVLAAEPTQSGYNFLQTELLEFSIVPVGANQSAVKTLKALGLWQGKSRGMSPEHQQYVHTAMANCMKAGQTLAQLLAELQDLSVDGGDDDSDNVDLDMGDDDVVDDDDEDDDTAAATVAAAKGGDRWSHIKSTDVVLDVIGLDPVGDPAAARHARSRGSFDSNDLKAAFASGLKSAVTDAATAVKRDVPDMVKRELARRRGRVD